MEQESSRQEKVEQRLTPHRTPPTFSQPKVALLRSTEPSKARRSTAPLFGFSRQSSLLVVADMSRLLQRNPHKSIDLRRNGTDNRSAPERFGSSC